MKKMTSLFYALALAAISCAPQAALAAVNTLAPNGTKVAASSLSITSIGYSTSPTAQLNVSAFALTQSSMATVTVDNTDNTCNVYVAFSNLVTGLPTGSMTPTGGAGMECVVTATAKTWRVSDGTWPLGYNFVHTANPSSLKPKLKNTY